MINGTPFTVLGVAPPGFRGTTLLSPDLWAPLMMAPEIQPRMSASLFTSRGAVWMLMGGRLAPGVSEAAAAKLWPGEDPIGRRFVRSDAPDAGGPTGTRQVEVIGIERTGKYVALNEPPTPFIYLPHAQQYMPRVSVLIRTSGPTVIPAVRAILAELNPNLPIVATSTLDAMSTIALLPQRLAGGIAGALGVVAVLIAGLGVYGVIAYSVARRTREFGIRVALGATPGDVLRLVFRQGALLTASGLVVGLLLALASTQLLASLLFGVGAADPMAFGLAAVVFGALSLAASFVPARRALAINPTVALRSE